MWILMNRFTTEFKVGVFTLVSAVIIAYMFFVLSPETFSSKKNKQYYTVVTNAAGIVVKTHVKTNGVTVGKVKDIKLQVNSTRIVFEVEEQVKIPEGSKIAIKEKGLLGDVFMEIIRADDVGKYIEDGGYIPPAEEQFNLSALLAVAGSIGQDIKKITSSLSQVIGGEEGARNIASIVTDIKFSADYLRGILEDNRDDIRRIITNIEGTTAALNRTVGNKEADLSEIIDNIKLATRDIKLFAQNIREIMDEENKDKIAKIIASFDKTMQDVEVTAKSVRLVANKIENGEGTIGKLIHDDKTLSELEGAIKDVREILAPATKLQVEVDYHGEIRKDKSTQHYFNVLLRTRPDKFYLLGFTDGQAITDTIVESVNTGRDEASPDAIGGMSKVRQREVKKAAIRFNAQMAKRWNQAQLRFGLFESSGGLAGDYYLWDDRLRLTLEAFDWDSNSYIRRSAHIKSYLSILFFNHIYAIIGVDDITRLDQSTGKVAKSPNIFVGAGFNFNDDDLKAVFGTAALVR